jgi:hypothetical protein
MNRSHRNANVLTARFFVLLVAAAGRVDAADRQPGHIDDDDFVMPNIHFGYQIRQGKFAKVKAKSKLPQKSGNSLNLPSIFPVWLTRKCFLVGTISAEFRRHCAPPLEHCYAGARQE